MFHDFSKMEEIDNIIIDSLKHIHCDIDDDISSLRSFTPDDVVNAVVSCLETITPEIKFPHKLPPSMSLRLKLATDIATHIKHMGYRGDMGYQTILYCNEVEVRRVLMFLVERLPRETSKTIHSEELGQVPQLLRNLETRLKSMLHKPWLPCTFLKHGVRNCGDIYVRQTCGHCYPLQTVNIRVPDTQQPCSEAIKQYWVHHLPDVTKQCSTNNLIPSLLFKDNEFSSNQMYIIDKLHQRLQLDNTVVIAEPELSKVNGINTSQLEKSSVTSEATDDKLSQLKRDVETYKTQLNKLQTDSKSLEAKLLQVNNQKAKEEKILKESIEKIKIKSKSLTVLSKEENMLKLKNLVDKGTERLVDLANQWNEVQTPLLEQYKSLQMSLTTEESKLQDEQQKLETARKKYEQLSVEMKEKGKLEQQLVQEFEKISKHTNRSAYTRRILEIIANIKKQNEEITKILKDTKNVQKDINNLNGQLERSFTLSDELIFRDAKQDETARKAYKLLVTLHTDCGEVIQTVTNLGLTERESRNLQEQIDAEMAREITAKLEKVSTDLAEVQNETALLIKQMKENT